MIKNKLCSAILAATISASGYAAMAPVKMDGDWKDRLFFEAGALYGSINDKSLSAYDYAQTADSGLTNVQSHKLNKTYDWGFTLAVGGFLTSDKKHDVVFSYTNLTVDKTYNTSGERLYNELGQVNTSGSSLLYNASATAKKDQVYQAFNLVNHNQFLSSLPESVKLFNFYGVRFVHFKNDLKATYSDSNDVDTINYQSKLYGIGPQLGIGSEWRLNKIFSVGGDAAALFIVGKESFDWSESRTGYTSGTYNQNKDDVWTVPGLEMNLYARAMIDFNNNKQLAFKAGFGGVKYMGTISNRINSERGGNDLAVRDSIVLSNFFATVSYYC